ncbi:hypothetical protein NLI96_g3353 [Meripilus lineatus]|uniref:Uncharacterized protein n=1 Tax=Meripilus lineatus TaxID=2056292 RepID=A0AAD5YKX4_9APHY|nr:hypothetical protein NLI96_g3353 [Physisporinus lineatus]
MSAVEPAQARPPTRTAAEEIAANWNALAPDEQEQWRALDRQVQEQYVAGNVVDGVAAASTQEDPTGSLPHDSPLWDAIFENINDNKSNNA